MPEFRLRPEGLIEYGPAETVKKAEILGTGQQMSATLVEADLRQYL